MGADGKQRKCLGGSLLEDPIPLKAAENAADRQSGAELAVHIWLLWFLALKQRHSFT